VSLSGKRGRKRRSSPSPVLGHSLPPIIPQLNPPAFHPRAELFLRVGNVSELLLKLSFDPGLDVLSDSSSTHGPESVDSALICYRGRVDGVDDVEDIVEGLDGCVDSFAEWGRQEGRREGRGREGQS